MKLTSVQREVLLALIDLYNKSRGKAVKGEDIAGLINKNPGTIRNQMQSLRSLGLVDGVPGPKGGYRPTTEGYKTLSFERYEKAVPVPIFSGGYILKGINVSSIELISIPDSKKCKATIHAIGNIKTINVGDVIKIGPTPINRLIILGKVLGRDDMDNVLLIEILEMTSIPKEKIINIATTNIKSISPNTSVRAAAKILVKEMIRGAPIVQDDKPIGIISTIDVTRALAENKENEKVEEVMSRDIRIINENSPLSTAIEELEKHDVSRLIVTDDNGDSKGIITRTDILCRIARLCKDVPFAEYAEHGE